MSPDRETISVYDARAEDYAAMIARENHPGLEAFLAAVGPDAHVLDLGCGTGAMAAKMMAAGLTVDAVDASDGMIEIAQKRGVPARKASFDDLSAVAQYDGIWANFSLLHAPRAALPGHLAAIHRALRPGGHFHIGMKLGEGEERDGIGRFYTYYSEAELDGLLSDARFTPLQRAHGSGKGLSGEVAPWIWILSHG